MNQKMKFTTLIYSGLRNKPGRNLATIFCFAFIAANIFSAQYLLAGTAMSVDQGITRMGADHLVVPAQYSILFRGARSGVENTVAIIKVEPTTLRINADMVDKVSKIPGVRTVSPQVYVTTLNLSELSSMPVDIFGIDPKSDFTIQPWLQRPLGHPMGNDEAILGSEIPTKVGSDLSIGEHTYTVVGKLDPTQSSTDRTVFLRLDDAYALAGSDSSIPNSAQPLSPGLVNAILVKVEPGADPDMVASRIQQPFAYSYITVVSRHFSLDPISQDIQGLPKLLGMMSLLVIIAAFPLIALIASMVANERQREIGILKSLGATRRSVFVLIVSEGLILAALGGIAGILVSFIALLGLDASGALNSAFQVSFRMPDMTGLGIMAGTALLVVIIIGSVATLYPAYRNSRINPYDAIRHEGQS